MKNAFIIHGFNGDTKYTFGPSLKKFLEENEYNVIMPNFPIRSEATYKKWSHILDKYKDLFNSETIVIAHSIGNPFFIKYLFQNKLQANTYISVAGFCDIFKVPDREDLNKAFIDFSVSNTETNYCRDYVKNKFSLYSDTDHVIPFNILENFVEKINSSPIFIKGRGHFGNRDNITRVPEIEEIIKTLF